MANINEDIKYYLNIINTATKGEDVRDAIIALLEMANTGVTDAYTLNGHPASDFALQSDMDTILPLDNAPRQGGTHPVGSGDLYDYFYSSDGIITALNKVLEDYSEGTIANKIYQLGQIRKDIREAINIKDKHVDPYDAFNTYADKIKDIAQSPNIDTTTLNVTDNGEYEADEGEAYKTVNVDVSKHLKTKKITTNGTYKAEDDDAYGYKEVEVELSTGSSGSGAALITKSIDASNLPDTPESKTYKAKDDSEGALGYSEVTVDVSGKLAPKEYEIDPFSFEEETIKASDDDLYGWTQIKIISKTGTGPFTVEFWQDDTKIESVTVNNPGGSATCTKMSSIVPPTGQVFAGWEPKPVNVMHNMKCYATFRDEEEHSSEHESPLSWGEIADDKGASMLVGEYKILFYPRFIYNDIEYPAGSLCMMKVAGGKDANGNYYPSENGTTSTFLSVEPLKGVATNTAAALTYYSKNKTYSQLISREFMGYPDSDLANFLNNGFYNGLFTRKGSLYNYTADIASAIHDVEKCSVVYVNEGDEFSYTKTSNELIWIPSLYEMRNYNYMPSYVTPEAWGTNYKIVTDGVIYPSGHSQSVAGSGRYRTLTSGNKTSDQIYLESWAGSQSSGSSKTVIHKKKNDNVDYSEGIPIYIGFCL